MIDPKENGLKCLHLVGPVLTLDSPEDSGRELSLLTNGLSADSRGVNSGEIYSSARRCAAVECLLEETMKGKLSTNGEIV